MSAHPDITFRDALNPTNVLATLSYVQSASGGNNLPVLHGQNSNLIKFRMYNNWARNSSIATAINLRATVYDGSGTASHSGNKLPVSQSWVRIYESGFGENSVTPGLYTVYAGLDTAIGKAGGDIYTVEYGSSGSTTNQLRAGSTGSGVGFIEFTTYVQVPSAAVANTWTFSLSVLYEWVA